MAGARSFVASVRSSEAWQTLVAWSWLVLLALGIWFLIVAGGRSWDDGALWTVGSVSILAAGVLVLRDPVVAAWARWRSRHETRTQDRADGDVQRTVAACGVALLAGLVALMIFAYAMVGDTAGRIEIVGSGLLVAGAAALLGALLGFLFGIPRTLQDTAERQAASGDTTPSPSRDAAAQYGVNTNLEQISDWLTKILVGVGLTQFDTVVDRGWAMAGVLAPRFGGTESGGQVLVVCLGLHFAVTGFFFGYLLTRLFLTGAFIRAEQLQIQIRKEVVVAVEGTVNQAVSKQATVVFEARAAEGEIFKSLYARPPAGFEQAIALATRYIEAGRIPSAAVYTYLAAAHGQRFLWEQTHENRSAVLDDARARAYAAATRAIELDPFEKARMASLFHAGPDSLDDDLAVFQPFPEFHELLD